MRGFTAVLEAPRSEGAPVLLLLHGTGGDEQSLLPLGRALAGDAGLLAPRGPVTEGDGVPRFFTRIPTGEPGPYPFTFDDAEIADRGRELAEAARERLAEEGLADRPLIAVGFSNGANMATVLPLLEPELLRAVVAFAPMPVMTAPPEASLATLGAWLGTGRHDPIATPEGVEAVARTLADRGAACAVARYEGGHEVTREAADAAAGWLGTLRAATADPGKPLP
ncbi:alpha/beta hydrolase [Egibacter rhizosphaerae]|uniref:Alpha/beta hydrolase n=1 Tax=Egibacter rhizosphaerae TaxID=1670831 RepID=A0A411YDR7_9ACTN|nr:alpha/beta hydrolase [Egibacter rhizosphaerae]QBI19287.1 alpha/beta hydrolase [Egibacter rhizosphaerae]